MIWPPHAPDRPHFGDGRWHTLGELRTFEKQLREARIADPQFSDELRICTSSDEKLRRDELIPLLNLANAMDFADDLRFLKPSDDRGIDLEIDCKELRLVQITKAYPTWTDDEGKPIPGGYDHRLSVEELTNKGIQSGYGPFTRKNGQIERRDDGMREWSEIRTACARGLREAFCRKKNHQSRDIVLAVHAERYCEVMDNSRFLEVVQCASRECPLPDFKDIIVFGREPGYLVRLSELHNQS